MKFSCSSRNLRLTLLAVLCGIPAMVRADYSNSVAALNPLVYYRFNETAAANVLKQAVRPVELSTNLGSAGFVGALQYHNGFAHGDDPNISAAAAGSISAGAVFGSANSWGAVNGSSCYGVVSGGPEINPTPKGPFSIEAWINPAGTPPSGIRT